MKEEADRVTSWLLDASADVPRDYMQLPVAGVESPIYRERVYCYELYHQWRTRWPNDYRFQLSGEIDKQGHPLIRSEAKPDFLVHVPGNMENLIVMEVKQAFAPIAKMVKDFVTLNRFVSGLQEGNNYFIGYFWIFGARLDAWRSIQAQLANSIEARKIDVTRIRIVLHEAARHRAMFVDW